MDLNLITIIVVILVLAVVYKKRYCKEYPKIRYKRTPRNDNLVNSITFLQKPYEYILWGSSYTLQTCFATAGRLFWNTKYRREILDTPDGGVIALDYVDEGIKDDSIPVVLLIPGICSTSKANYIKCFATQCKNAGYRPVVFIPRGCDIIKTPKIFTLGDTTDLRQVVHHLHEIYPKAPIMSVAFSLGANVLVKYLGEVNINNEPIILQGGISLAQGYDAVTGIEHLHKSPFWEKGLVFRLTSLIKRHSHVFDHLVDVAYVTAVRTVEEFDRHFTCKLHGFDDPRSYYQQHSCVSYIKDVSVPLFLVNAMDDPLVLRDNIPFDAPTQNENVYLITTDHGGHLGWCEGYIYPNLVHWHDKLGVHLLNAILANKNSK